MHHPRAHAQGYESWPTLSSDLSAIAAAAAEALAKEDQLTAG